MLIKITLTPRHCACVFLRIMNMTLPQKTEHKNALPCSVLPLIKHSRNAAFDRLAANIVTHAGLENATAYSRMHHRHNRS
jgi:hypothetical protein